MENNISTVNVSLQSNSFFEVIDRSTQTVNFSQTGEQLTYFNVRIKNATGIGKVKITATSGSEKAEDEVELDVRNPNPVMTNTQQVTLAPGQHWQAMAAPIGLPATSTAMVEISSIPSMNLQKKTKLSNSISTWLPGANLLRRFSAIGVKTIDQPR
jgi:uncharacterized protein YfaS (alpha-2-macroglobulin family)